MFTLLRGLIRTMRPKQWLTKEHLHLRRRRVRLQTLCARPVFPDAVGQDHHRLCAVCLISSTIYIINDIADVEAIGSIPRRSIGPSVRPAAHPDRRGAAIVIGLFTSSLRLRSTPPSASSSSSTRCQSGLLVQTQARRHHRCADRGGGLRAARGGGRGAGEGRALLPWL